MTRPSEQAMAWVRSYHGSCDAVALGLAYDAGAASQMATGKSPWTRDELVQAFRAHGSEIREADEWRPLADHFRGLLAVADANERAVSEEVVIGLLEVARHAMPDTFWVSDSRVNAAREWLDERFPSDEELRDRFDARREYRDSAES